MSISQVTSTDSSMPEIVEQGSNSMMDKYAFLKLLTTQLANQDPLSPMDTDTMAQQQAMYAQVEQLMNLNDTITSFVSSQEDMMLGIAGVFNTLESASFLGKDITFYTDQVSVGADGVAQPLYFDLTQDGNLSFTVKDENGVTVKAVGNQAVEAGEQVVIPWDGTNANGKPVDAGLYSIAVTMTTADGTGMSGKTYSEAGVRAIDFREGTPVLTLADGRKVDVTDILALSEPTETL